MGVVEESALLPNFLTAAAAVEDQIGYLFCWPKHSLSRTTSTRGSAHRAAASFITAHPSLSSWAEFRSAAYKTPGTS